MKNRIGYGLCAAVVLFTLAITHAGSSSIGQKVQSGENQVAAALAAASVSASPRPSATVGTRRQIDIDKAPLDVGRIEAQIGAYNALLRTYGKKPEAVSVAASRMPLMKAVARADTRKFITLALSTPERNSLSAEAQKFVEKFDTYSGTLSVFHSDDFKHPEKSSFSYALVASSARYDLISAAGFSELSSGKVRVRAYALDDIAVVSGPGSIIPSAAQKDDSALGAQRTLVVLVSGVNGAPKLSASEVRKTLFDQSSDFQIFYRHQSYGKTSFTGKVYEMKIDRAIDSGFCYTGGRFVSFSDREFVKFLEDQAINIGDYDHVVFAGNIDGGCSQVGRSDVQIGGTQARLSVSYVGVYSSGALAAVTAHELGHALGVMHANAVECNGSCRHVEYGNYYDAMGNQSANKGLGDFNALYKEQLHWLSARDILNVTASGNYSFSPIESQSGYRAVKVVNPKIGPQSVLYLETRKDAHADVEILGYEDAKLNYGLLLNVPQLPSNLSYTAPEQIHMAKEPVFALHEGSYSLSDTGVTFSDVTADPAKQKLSLHVEIGDPKCIAAEPRINDDTQIREFKARRVPAGGIADVNVFFTNMNKSWCFPTSPYKLEITDMPAGWKMQPSEFTDAQVPPLGSAFFMQTFKIPADAKLGDVSVVYTLRDMRTGVSHSYSSLFTVTKPPAIISVDTPKVSLGEEVKLHINYADTDNLMVSMVGPEAIDFTRLQSDSQGIVTFRIPEGSGAESADESGQSLKTGNYQIVLVAGGASSKPAEIMVTNESVQKITPKVSLNERPKLELMYDVNKHEAGLTATARVKIEAASVPVYIYGRASALLINKVPSSVPGGNAYLTLSADFPSLQQVTDRYGNSVFVLPAGSTVDTTFFGRANPNSLAPGFYTARLTNILLSSSNLQDFAVLVPGDESNAVTVIGERSPYVTSVNVSASSCGDVVDIQGARFSGSKNMIELKEIGDNDGGPAPITGFYYKKVSYLGSTNKGTQIRFASSLGGTLPAGFYSVLVTNADLKDGEGKSNGYVFEVKNKKGTAACPTPNATASPLVVVRHDTTSGSSQASAATAGSSRNATTTATSATSQVTAQSQATQTPKAKGGIGGFFESIFDSVAGLFKSSPRPTASPSPSATALATNTASPTRTASVSASPSKTATPSSSVTSSPSVTASPSGTTKVTASPTKTTSVSASPKTTASASPSVTTNASVSASASPKATVKASQSTAVSTAPAADTIAPTMPANFRALAISTSDVYLSWSPSTDNKSVTGYKLYKYGSNFAITNETSAYDRGLNAGATYSYSVVAYDSAGNASAPAFAYVTMPAVGAAPSDTSSPSSSASVTASPSGSASVTASPPTSSSSSLPASSPSPSGSPVSRSLNTFTDKLFVGLEKSWVSLGNALFGVDIKR